MSLSAFWLSVGHFSEQIRKQLRPELILSSFSEHLHYFIGVGALVILNHWHLALRLRWLNLAHERACIFDTWDKGKKRKMGKWYSNAWGTYLFIVYFLFKSFRHLSFIFFTTLLIVYGTDHAVFLCCHILLPYSIPSSFSEPCFPRFGRGKEQEDSAQK